MKDDLGSEWPKGPQLATTDTPAPMGCGVDDACRAHGNENYKAGDGVCMLLIRKTHRAQHAPVRRLSGVGSRVGWTGFRHSVTHGVGKTPDMCPVVYPSACRNGTSVSM